MATAPVGLVAQPLWISATGPVGPIASLARRPFG